MSGKDAYKVNGGMLSDLQDPNLKKAKRLGLYKRYLKEVLTPGLPHLYGFKFFPWHRELFNAALDLKKTMRLVPGSNQCGKSLSASIETITWATDRSLWPKLWPILKPDKNGYNVIGGVPSIFWYFHTDGHSAKKDLESWERKYLPKLDIIGENHPIYSWKLRQNKDRVISLSFATGVTVDFHTYNQSVDDIQGAMVFKIHADEELPYSFWAELTQRISIPNGYFSMICAATKGQVEWRLALEEMGTHNETHKEAWKRRVTKFDCIKFEDGTDSEIVTLAGIKQQESRLTKREARIRIYGQFAPLEGLMIHAFSLSKNLYPNSGSLPKEWNFSEDIYSDCEAYIGVDTGSGNEGRSPTAIVVGILSACRSRMVIPWVWRGDNVSTTAGDVANKIHQVLFPLFKNVKVISFDPAGSGVDFGKIARGLGMPAVAAKKDRQLNIALINTLFGTQSLTLLTSEVEARNVHLLKMASEFQTLQESDSKSSKIRDDLIDALRYMLEKVPFDMEKILSRAHSWDKPVTPEIVRPPDFSNVEDEARWKAHRDSIKKPRENFNMAEYLSTDIFRS